MQCGAATNIQDFITDNQTIINNALTEQQQQSKPLSYYEETYWTKQIKYVVNKKGEKTPEKQLYLAGIDGSLFTKETKGLNVNDIPPLLNQEN